MANDSSTGGYLVPTSVNGDLNDDALQDFLQGIVVGVTGLAGDLVRPRFQVEPPNPPDAGTSWAAIGPGPREREHYSAIVEKNGSAVAIRNRIIQVLVSFYGPQAETNGELLAMGLEIAQNRETMKASGFNLVSGVEGPTIAPALIKSQWYYRVDYTFKVRQQQQYTYPILTLKSAQATLEAQSPGSTQPTDEPISVNAPA